MNKKFNKLCVAMLTLLVSAGTLMGAENRNLGMYISNTQVAFSNTTGYPRVEQGKTLVPINLISSYLGYNVGWDQKAQKVTISKKDTTIDLTIGSNKALVNRKTVVMDTTAKVYKNRTYVPLRFVAENMGVKVEYKVVDGKQAVYLTLPNGEEVKVPEVEVGTLVGTASDNHEKNLENIRNFFGEELHSSTGDPSWNPVGGSLASSFIFVNSPSSHEDYEVRIVLTAWYVEGMTSGYKIVPPKAKALFDYYLPNGSDKLYKIVDDGYNNRLDDLSNYVDKDIQHMIGSDGRKVVIHSYQSGLRIEIGHKK